MKEILKNPGREQYNKQKLFNFEKEKIEIKPLTFVQIEKIVKEIGMTKEDIKRGGDLFNEWQIPKPLDEKKLFAAFRFIILAAAENFEKNLKIDNWMAKEGFNSPQKIEENKKRFLNILSRARYPKMKKKRFEKFLFWWKKTDLIKEIIEDTKKGNLKGRKIRNKLAAEDNSIGLKGASLILNWCGYKDTVALDVWMLRFLNRCGVGVISPDYKTVSGLKDKDYPKCEKIFSDISRVAGLEPAILQHTLWTKFSESFRKNNKLKDYPKLFKVE